MIPSLKKSLYSALVFFGTLMVLSVGYAAWTTLGHVSSGNPLTATSWNALVDNIADLDSRWGRVGGNIAFTGGNVGIGTTNLQQNRLSIAAGGNWYSNGALKITNFDGTFATYLTNAAGGLYISQDGITDHVVINSSGNVTVNGGVTASKITTSTAWTAVPGNATWTSSVTCRRIGSFLQLNGQFSLAAGGSTTGWPVTMPNLPSNCWPSISLNYIPGTCWANSTVTSIWVVTINTWGAILVHNSTAFTFISLSWSYPAD